MCQFVNWEVGEQSLREVASKQRRNEEGPEVARCSRVISRVSVLVSLRTLSDFTNVSAFSSSVEPCASN